jgi:putative ABC transport system substrate-binding protein
VNVRRQLLLAIGAGAFLYPIAGRTLDSVKRPRIGYLSGLGTAYFTRFRDELGRLGHIDGKNVVIDHRAAEGDLKRIPDLVQELVESDAAVLVLTNVVAIRAAQRATTTIPIVMSISIDPVAAGFAQSFRQPGGNITGIYTLRADLAAKRIELMHELIPGISRIAVLWDPDGPGPKQRFQEYSAAAKAKKLEIQSLEVRAQRTDLEAAIQAARSNRAQALLVIGNPFIGKLFKRVAELAEQNGMPSISESRGYPDAGGLLSYGEDLDEQPKVLASIVARVLKGAKPANLPIEQPTKFELVINLKTAKVLGIKIPPEIMVRADRIVQ